jgi:hypothetical protein
MFCCAGVGVVNVNMHGINNMEKASNSEIYFRIIK